MERVQSVAVIGWMLALVLTSGASAPWRLAILTAPLLVFPPPRRWWLPVCLVVVPSALELGFHGDWVGPAGARLRLLAGVAAGLFAVALGQELHRSRALRRVFGAAMPWFAAGALAVSVARFWGGLPASWTYLSGNHLSAVATMLFVPVLALKAPPTRRLVGGSLLVAAILLSESRWGIWVAAVFVPIMVTTVVDRGWSRICYGITAISVLVPWLVIEQLDISKGGLIKALAPLSFQRPWTGVGPSGAEALSLQFVPRMHRLTHIESLPFDWAATFGWPAAVVLLIGLLWITFFARPAARWRGQRMQGLAAIGLAAAIAHELFDFSLASGAAASCLGLLIGLRIGQPEALRVSAVGRALAIGLVLLSIGFAHRFDPIEMERSGRLDELSERLGQRPFRYWLKRAIDESDTAAKAHLFARSVEVAPGNTYGWFHLGNELLKLGRQQQALASYRQGLMTTPPGWMGAATHEMANLPEAMIGPAIGDHLGAARVVARKFARGEGASLAVVEELDRKHEDALIRRWLLDGLMRPGGKATDVVPALWRLGFRRPLFDSQAFEVVQAIAAHEPRIQPAELFLRLVQRDSRNCRSLSFFRGPGLHKLRAVTKQLIATCRRPLIGRSKGLEALAELRAFDGP